MTNDLAGDVALVTGGARGLGAAIAQELAEQGATVVLADLEAGPCEAKVAELRGLGLEVDHVVMDVADPASVAAAADQVTEKHGDLSVLVNNAGTTGRATIDDPEGQQLWRRIIEVNLNGVYNSIFAFIEPLKRTRGRIVSVSSVVALRSGFTSPAYAASKGGVSALTRDLARELAPHGIRVNAVAPGYFDSGLGMKGNPEAEAWISWHCPMKRFGEPHEVAGPVAFLVSAKAGFVTGVTLPVDGGYLVV